MTNIKEQGLEDIIVESLCKQNGYEQGANADYNKEYAIDETRLFRFLQTTQPKQMEQLGLKDPNAKSAQFKKTKFLTRIRDAVSTRGVVDVLRRGVKRYPAQVIMFYATPSEKNENAKIMFGKNIFSVTRQLEYSIKEPRLALDLCIFINGLPVITCELKNSLTGQTTSDAVNQYKNDRSPHELLFQFKQCLSHFAVDDSDIQFCTELKGKDSWFLPFNKGCNDGAGNPPNPDGIKTDYFWKYILTKNELANIIENYVQVTKEKDEKTGRVTERQIFPRYHQLSCVEALLADVKKNGIGKRYLIQHSAGSGKSNSIAWLANQLVGLEKDGKPVVDSILVVTDRRILDRQIANNIDQFTQLKNTMGHAEEQNA